MITYGDLKTSILQRIFAITGSNLVQNTTTNPYLNMMPTIIRDGLNELATAGKYIIKSHEITQDGTGTGVVQKYDFSSLVASFYSFGDNRVYLDDGEKYGPALDYKIEANRIFVLPTTKIGTWTVYYNSYPQQITKDTPNETELDLDPEIEELLILYTCPAIYLDDDAGFCTLWLNMYEEKLKKLNPNVDQPLIIIEHIFESW
jgi:hypothetical protein